MDMMSLKALPLPLTDRRLGMFYFTTIITPHTCRKLDDRQSRWGFSLFTLRQLDFVSADCTQAKEIHIDSFPSDFLCANCIKHEVEVFDYKHIEGLSIMVNIFSEPETI